MPLIMPRFETFKTAFILGGLAAPLGWLWALFLFPDTWTNSYGYNQLMWLIGLSLAHLPAGFFMTIGARSQWISMKLGVCLLSTPPLHLLGSRMEEMGALVMFVLPSILAVYFGLRELVSRH